jgi:hypothetical protein
MEQVGPPLEVGPVSLRRGALEPHALWLWGTELAEEVQVLVCSAWYMFLDHG